MSTITSANVSAAVDLNLLLVLHTVLREGSATAAARRLHVTQSAVSNSLARLREIFKDPLVVRSGKGLVPTPRAQSLSPRLGQALAILEEVVAADAPFDPARSTRRFTIACPDAIELHDVPGIFAIFARQMPLASLRVVSIDYLVASNGLVTGEIDVALGPPSAAGPGFAYRPLYRQGAMLVVRRDHPQVRGTITRAKFNSLPHVDTLLVQGQPGEGHKIASRAMARQGLSRRVVLAVSHFASAAVAAARTDCLAGLPERLARFFCELLPLRMVSFPLGAELSFETGMIWHNRTEQDPACRALRDIIREALEQPALRGAHPPRRRPRSAPRRRAR